MREWLNKGNDYSDLQAIGDHIYSNFDLLQIFSLIPIDLLYKVEMLMLNVDGEYNC